jgi:hypothetical protein
MSASCGFSDLQMYDDQFFFLSEIGVYLFIAKKKLYLAV